MRSPDGKAPPNPWRDKPWQDDVDRRISNGDDPKTAWTNTILKGIYDGDLRPLADAIGSHEFKQGIVFSCLSAMIIKGVLIIKRRRQRGKPKRDSVRDWDVARRYEELVAKKTGTKKTQSDDAFEKVADEFKTTAFSARKAVTNWRKRNKTSRR
jgi:hypothetical protein